MRKLAAIAMTIATGATLTGCANNVWVHPSKNNAQFNQDKNDCTVQANSAIKREIVPQQYTPPNYQTNCNTFAGSTSCSTTAQTGADMTSLNQSIADSNTQRQRESFFSSCMQARGWTLRTAESVATMNAQNKDKIEQYKAGFQQISAEVRALCTDPAYAAFYAKASCSAGSPTIAQLSDTSRANKTEKIAIQKIDIAWAKARDERIDLTRNTLSPPDLVTALVDYTRRIYDAGQKIRLDLYNGKITWGQYNTERKNFAPQADAEYKAILKRFGK